MAYRGQIDIASDLSPVRKSTVDLSVVVVNYNNGKVLEACLPSLDRALTGIDAEVVISDNGSTDGSLAWARATFPKYRILENNANLGFAEANNRAFDVVRGRHILLLNPDTVVHEGAVRAMTALLEENARAGAVGCKLLNADGSRQISARTFPTWMSYLLEFTGLSHRFTKSRFFGRYHMTFWNGESARVVDWVTGAALMIKREVLERVRGLDHYFFLTYDEVDWCHRIKDAGYQVWYTPKGVITHLDRQSEPQKNPKPEARIKYLTVERNSRVRYFVKHHGLLHAILIEMIHLFMAAGFLMKAAVFGTGRSPVVVMEHKLLWRLYWRTLRRVPAVLRDAATRLALGVRDGPAVTLFVNPYTTDDR